MGKQMLYGYPDMGRTGLGHSLLAWARCAIWCRDTGATMLAPRWLRPRIGPYLRGERDKRNYFLLFHRNGYTHEPTRSWVLNTANHLYAELDLPERGVRVARPTVVIFRNAMAHNEQKLFHHVYRDGPYLLEQLTGMTRTAYLPAKPAAPFAAVHVRMGDFGTATAEELRAGATNSRIPVEWYVAAARQLRAHFPDLPLVVFSDGTDDALAPLLALDNVTRSPRQQSVTDMLSIAQARVLIASGSGFSLWGSFLGSVPRICYPGQTPTRGCPTLEPFVEWENDGAFSAEFVAAVEGRLAASAG